MTKPGPFAMFWGHGLVLVGLGLTTCWFVYLSFQGSAAIIPAIIALAASASSKAAHEKRRAYQAWQREWAAMGGASTTGLSRRTQQRIGAVVVWVLVACVMISVADDPDAALWVNLFWWASAAMPVIGLWRLFRRAAPSGATRGKQATVAVCLKAPSRGNDLRQAYAALPEHCAIVLRRDY